MNFGILKVPLSIHGEVLSCGLILNISISQSLPSPNNQVVVFEALSEILLPLAHIPVTLLTPQLCPTLQFLEVEKRDSSGPVLHPSAWVRRTCLGGTLMSGVRPCGRELSSLSNAVLESGNFQTVSRSQGIASVGRPPLYSQRS